jgi:hypothetical protein
MGAFGLQSITSFLEISSRNTSSVPSRIPLIKFSVNSFFGFKEISESGTDARISPKNSKVDA